MMTTVTLNGALGKACGRKVWRLDVGSVAEAFHAINVQTGFALHRNIVDEIDATQGYHIRASGMDVGEDKLAMDLGARTIKVTPILQGADTKGILTIVAGVALIAIGIATYGSSAAIGVQLVGLGLAVSLGGVARLLMSAPPQTIGTQDKTKSSYIFSGAVNTVQQGECVPIAYGNPWTGSAVGQAGMEAVDINV
jgi:predicted phage tail protein